MELKIIARQRERIKEKDIKWRQGCQVSGNSAFSNSWAQVRSQWFLAK
jgi:hypothetical protein